VRKLGIGVGSLNQKTVIQQGEEMYRIANSMAMPVATAVSNNVAG